MDTIEAMLTIGHTRTAAAKSVGIKPTDFHNVVREGKSKRGKCHDILITVLQSEGKAQVRLETIIIRDAEVNVKTAQWLLARRFRLKERHEPEIDILRKLDYNRLDQEDVKLKLLQEKLRLLQEKSGDSMSSDDWRAIMDEAEQAKTRVKSVH
mgnify:FL=1|jgi:hypothetical protein|tara:strand:+ start:336 stop:794 length:459 start_codon:yes stop_codon:yes gene_type:complete